jgi:hypothetical protein
MTKREIQPWAHPTLAIETLRSRAGWYIGQMSPEDGPYSRLSKNYYRTEEDARTELLNDTWERKPRP